MRTYVGGTFDLFHPGHVELLRRAKEYGDVYVALNTDDYAESLKGRRPIMDYGERATMLLACEYVDEVLANHGNERDLLDLVKPRTIYYGNDGTYTRSSYLALFGLRESDLDRMGIVLIFAPRYEGVSSTDVIERVLHRRGSQPRERDRATEDARQSDVPDKETGRGLCPCEWPDSSGCCRASRRSSSHHVPCS